MSLMNFSSLLPEDQQNLQEDTSDIKYALRSSFESSYDASLQGTSDFKEVFEVVRRSVRDLLGVERGGLDLYLRDLPLGVGAFHKVGTNMIVLNRALIDLVVKSQVAFVGIKSFVFSVLLHEYLHSLGIYDELQVRRLTYEISREALGERHLATFLAEAGPWAILKHGSSKVTSFWS